MGITSIIQYYKITGIIITNYFTLFILTDFI